MSLKYQLNCKQTFKLSPSIKFCLLFLLFIVQLLSNVHLWDPMSCGTPGFSVLHYILGLLKPMSTEVCGAMSPEKINKFTYCKFYKFRDFVTLM